MILCTLGYFKASGQNRSVIIVGNISDENHSAVQYAAVKNLNTTDGIITNDKGNYTLKTTVPVWLEASALGYKTWQTVVKDRTKDTIYLNITLKTDSFQLRAVNIVGQNTPIAIDESEQLMDFDFKDNRVWLLYKIGKRSRLCVIDSTDKKQAYIDLNFKSDSLAHTVHGYLYTGNKDTAYCFSWDSNKIHQFTVSLYNMRMSIYNLIEFRYPFYYKGSMSNDLSSIRYFANSVVNHKTQRILLYSYTSKEIKNHNGDINMEIDETIGTTSKLHYSMLPSNYKEAVDSSIDLSFQTDDVKLSGKQQLQVATYQNMIRTISAQAHIINDSLYIFNFDNDSVYVFDASNKFKRQMSLIFDVQGIKYKEKGIIVDEEKKHCYFKYQLHSIDYLQEVDLGGREKFSPQAIKFPYIHKIRISKGVAYFSYYENSSNDGVSPGHLSVYKQKLITH